MTFFGIKTYKTTQLTIHQQVFPHFIVLSFLLLIFYFRILMMKHIICPKAIISSTTTAKSRSSSSTTSTTTTSIMTTTTMSTLTATLAISKSFRPDYTSTPTYKGPKTSTPIVRAQRRQHKAHAVARTSSFIDCCSFIRPCSVLEAKQTRNSTFKERLPRLSLAVDSTSRSVKNRLKMKLKQRKRRLRLLSVDEFSLGKMIVSQLAVDAGHSASTTARQQQQQQQRGSANNLPFLACSTCCCSIPSKCTEKFGPENAFGFDQLFYSDKQFQILKRKLVKRRNRF